MVIAHNPQAGFRIPVCGYPANVCRLPRTTSVKNVTYVPGVFNKHSGCACPHVIAVTSAGLVAQT
jgi:hypothetical protein